MDHSLVYEPFRNEHEKFDEFLKLANDATNNRIGEASAIAKMTELIKGNHNLFLSLILSFPNAKLYVTKILLADGKAFLHNVKKRFETVDTHVFPSVIQSLRMFKDKKKTKNEVQEEVLSLLYYHEDLTDEFTSFFT